MTENPVNPFPGLRPFRRDERHLFFGRERHTAELLERLRRSRFLAVVGTSGSGKSSLVTAGVLPELYRGSLLEAGSHWEVAAMRPGGDPVRNLAEALIGAELYDDQEEDIVAQVGATLRRSGLGLVEAVRQSDLAPDANFLLVVDQFEEMFRFRGDAAGRGRDEAAHFVELLLEASRQKRPAIYVVLTMRSDYLGDCTGFLGLAEAVNAGEYLIPRMNRDQRRSAIEGPIRVGGQTITPRLLQKLLNDLGDDPDQLPILQHALMRTWERWVVHDGNGAPIDLQHYESVGGMREALSRHADEVFDGLPDDRHRTVAGKLFKALTERGSDSRGVRRPARLARLCAIAEAQEGEVRGVIEAFRAPGRTFLMPPAGTPLQADTVIDLSHESLMRVWTRLREWAEAEEQSASIFRRLSETARLHTQGRAGLYQDPDLPLALNWRAETRPNPAWADQYGGHFEDAMQFLAKSEEAADRLEREKEAARQRELEQARALSESQRRAARIFKRFAIAMAMVALLAIGAFVFALNQQRQAENKEREADVLRREAVANAERERRGYAARDAAEGRSRFAQGEHAEAIAFLARSLDGNADNPAAVDLIFNLLAHAAPPGYRSPELDYGGSPVYASAATPDGRLVATASESSIRLWEPFSKQPVKEWSYNVDDPVVYLSGLAFGPDPEQSRLFLGYYGKDKAAGEESMLVDVSDPRMIQMAQAVRQVPESQGVVAPRFSTDGRHVLFGAWREKGPAGIHKARAVLWNSETGERTREIGSPGDMPAWSPDERWLLLASDFDLNLVDIKSGEPREGFRFEHPGDASPLSEFHLFSPDGDRILAISGTTAALWVHDARTGARQFGMRHDAVSVAPDEEVYMGEGIPDAPNSGVSVTGAFLPDGQHVLSAGTDKTVRLWDVGPGSGQPGAAVELEALWSVGIGVQIARDQNIPFSADGRRFMIRTRDGGCYLGELDSDPSIPPVLRRSEHVNDGFAFLADSGAVKPLVLPQRDVVIAAVSREGDTAVLGSSDGRVVLCDLRSGERTGRLEGPGGGIRSLVFSVDGSRLAALSEAGRIRVWERVSGKGFEAILDLEPTDASGPRSVSFTADGEGLLAFEETRVTRWEVGGGPPTVLSNHPATGWCEPGPGGESFVRVRGSRLEIINVESGVVRATVEAPGRILQVAFDPRSSQFATALEDQTVHLWSMEDWRPWKRLSLPSPDFESMDLHDSLLVVRSRKGIHLGSLQSGSFTELSSAGSGEVRSVATSPDGRLLAAVIEDGAGVFGQVWDTRHGAPITNRLPVSGAVSELAFLPGGRQVLFWPERPQDGPAAPGVASVWDVSLSDGGPAPRWLGEVATSYWGKELDEESRLMEVDRRESVRARLATLRGDSPEERFFRWLDTFPGTRPDSPFRLEPSDAYVEQLSAEADLALLNEAVRLRPRDARALARRAALRLADGDAGNPGTRTLCRADLIRARLLAPESAEVAWIEWMVLSRLEEPGEAADAHRRAAALGVPTGAELEALVAIHQRLESKVGYDVLRSFLTTALETAVGGGDTVEEVRWRLKRFGLAAMEGDFATVAEDWNVISDLGELPATVTPGDLLEQYLNAAFREANRLHALGRHEEAIALLKPVALIRRFSAPRTEVPPGAWMETLRQWEDPEERPLVGKGEIWQYLDNIADPGAGWNGIAGGDGLPWKSNQAPLGYGRRPVLNKTEIHKGVPEILTCYFRKEISVPKEDLLRSHLSIELLYDDGVVFYLNGRELEPLRSAMRPGPVGPQDTASLLSLGVPEKGYELFVLPLPETGLREGLNVIAAEVHQANPESSDLQFDCSVTATDLAAPIHLAGLLEGEAGAALLESCRAIVPGPLRDEWLREFRFLAFGESGGFPEGVPEHLWLQRLERLEEEGRRGERLATIEARIVALKGRTSPREVRLGKEWLTRKEIVLCELGRQDELEEVWRLVDAWLPRDPALGPKLIDLSTYYNAGLYDGRRWHGSHVNPGINHEADLEELPESFVPLHGVDFDLRGIVQLDWQSPYDPAISYPPSLEGIRIDQTSPAVHFLMSCLGFPEQDSADAGNEVARFLVHYADGTTAPALAAIHGIDLLRTIRLPSTRGKEERLGWMESNESARPLSANFSLSELIWRNPHPEKRISHIDFVSAKKNCGVFLVAITLE